MTRLPAHGAALGLLVWSAAAAGGPAAAHAPAAGRQPVRVERTVFLMGTLATFAVEATDRAAGLAKLERMVQVVERTEAELSTWRDDSVLSAVNRQPVGEALPLPAETCALLARVARWRAATGGAFDPAIGSLLAAWGLRAGGRRPDDETLAAARAAAGFDRLSFDRDACEITRRAPVVLDAGAFGKGEALDLVRDAERNRAGSWRIDFGGQVAVSGAASDGPWTVGIAHPAHRDRAVVEVSLAAGSLATSGGSERDVFLADGARIGHVVDPRSGRPVSRSASVSVWHASAFVADVLSTALYVMGPEEGFTWAAARGIAVCFLSVHPASGDVAVHATPAFRARFPLPRAGGAERQDGSPSSP